MWKKYMLGNYLRGFYAFKARSIKEAWKKGCARFNAGFPSPGSRHGRSVHLHVWDATVLPVLKTKWVIDQDRLPAAKRYYSNHEVNTVRDWVPVAEGMSKQKRLF